MKANERKMKGEEKEKRRKERDLRRSAFFCFFLVSPYLKIAESDWCFVSPMS